MVLHETDLTVSTKFCTNEGEICALTFPVILNLIYDIYYVQSKVTHLKNDQQWDISGSIGKSHDNILGATFLAWAGPRLGQRN